VQDVYAINCNILAGGFEVWDIISEISELIKLWFKVDSSFVFGVDIS
jgi:hypothetical protein